MQRWIHVCRICKLRILSHLLWPFNCKLQSLLNFIWRRFFSLVFFICFFGLFNAHSFRFCVNPQMNVAIKSTLIGQFDIWMKNESEKPTHTHTHVYSYSNSTRIKAWLQSVSRVVKVKWKMQKNYLGIHNKANNTGKQSKAKQIE